ncbi:MULTISPECIES: BON domain-containing protein [Microbacterium]|uniref:BON domain-containing protein n=1 Tax=Microbacterium TaxID=33882 RepID=UPI001469C3A0|nr:MULTISPECIES: BON domain-containing protein [Microbacterium]
MTVIARRDRDVRDSVQNELEWMPQVEASRIGVSVEDGAVTLSGEVDDFAQRVAAKRAALRVRGVRTVIDHLTVYPKRGWPVSEREIAGEVERALKAAVNVPDTVKAEIQDHTVVLTGEAEWDYQRRAAKRAVRELRGVYAVSDMIALAPRPTAPDTVDRIRSALARNALVDAGRIDVSVAGTSVVLSGSVTSWAERREAERAAWGSPHVTHVDNRVTVDPA